MKHEIQKEKNDGQVVTPEERGENRKLALVFITLLILIILIHLCVDHFDLPGEVTLLSALLGSYAFLIYFKQYFPKRKCPECGQSFHFGYWRFDFNRAKNPYRQCPHCGQDIRN